MNKQLAAVILLFSIHSLFSDTPYDPSEIRSRSEYYSELFTDNAKRLLPRVEKYTLADGKELWCFLEMSLFGPNAVFIKNLLSQASFTHLLLEEERLSTYLFTTQETFNAQPSDHPLTVAHFFKNSEYAERVVHVKDYAHTLLSNSALTVLPLEFQTVQEAVHAYLDAQISKEDLFCCNGLSLIMSWRKIKTFMALIPDHLQEEFRSLPTLYEHNLFAGARTMLGIENPQEILTELLKIIHESNPKNIHHLNLIQDSVNHVRHKKMIDTLLEITHNPEAQKILVISSPLYWYALKHILEKQFGTPETITVYNYVTQEQITAHDALNALILEKIMPTAQE